MKNIIRIAGLFLVGLMISTTASAYYVDGDIIRDGSGTEVGNYIGDMGNVNIGLSSIGVTGVTPNWIGTHYLSDGSGSYVDNDPDFTVETTHWYSFSASLAGDIYGVYELGASVTGFTVSFFVENGSDDYFHTVTASAEDMAIGSFYDMFTAPTTGNILVKIVGEATGGNASYRGRFIGAAVPIPPAALLFISALAGFGVIGRKKGSKTI